MVGDIPKELSTMVNDKANDNEKVIDININGLNTSLVVNCNAITGRIFASGKIYEEYELNKFLENVKEDSIIIDIGACYGQYALTSAKKAYKGMVIAVEANPYNFSLLRKGVDINTDDNNILSNKNVICVNKALSDIEGKAELSMPDTHPEGGSLYLNINMQYGFQKIEKMMVDVTTLDKLLDDLKDIGMINFDHSNIDMIKIDVEGNEMKVLRGAKKVLEQSKNLKILTEFSTDMIKSSGEDPRELLQLLLDRFKEVKILSFEEIPMVTDTTNNIIDKNNIDVKAEMGHHANLFCQ